ncbi:hypothetical protein HDU98_007357 [Podochytrium sp. JEL0797]|nr:hypothetical protein HDU98_007357 [Podochytrium sp. JEL0797]
MNFLESENVDRCYRFHTMENGSCCMRGAVPCASGKHRTEHHTEYSYAAYRSYLADFFKKDHEFFGTGCQADDLSCDPMFTLSLSCGVTHPSHGTDPNKFFVFLKCGHAASKQFLMLFDRAELMVDASSLDPLIRKYEDSFGTLARVDWIVEGDDIVGVQMHAQSSTMQTPSITRVLFEFESWDAPTPICGKIAVVSESHFGELAPPHNHSYPSLPAQTEKFFYHPPGSTLIDRSAWIPEPDTSLRSSIHLESTTTRTTMTVDISTSPTNTHEMFLISFLGRSMSVSLNQLRVAVVTALRNPNLGGVVLLFEESRTEYKSSVSAKAIVDVASRRVYAIRVDVAYEDEKAVRFFPVAPYGDAVLVNAKRAVKVVEARSALDGLDAFEVDRGVVGKTGERLVVVESTGCGGDGMGSWNVVEQSVNFGNKDVDVSAMEERVGAIVERQLNEFMATMSMMVPPAPSPSVTQVPVATDPILHLILAKLGDMDARMERLEEDRALQKLASVETLTVAVSNMTDALEACRDDSIEGTDTEAFEDIAFRLENVGISAEGLTEGVKEICAILEHRTASCPTTAVDTSVEEFTELSEVVSRLGELEARIELLPQVYREMMDSSLERQTNALVSTLSERRTRSPLHSPRGLSPLSPETTPPPTSPDSQAGSKRSTYRIPAVPNMGIAVGLSKLTERYRRASTFEEGL